MANLCPRRQMYVGLRVKFAIFLYLELLDRYS